MNSLDLLPPADPQPPAAPMVYVRQAATWEYKRLVFRPAAEALPDEAMLNGLGDEGWELVAVVSTADQAHFYLKRLRP